jgi:mRNA interferase MazF
MLVIQDDRFGETNSVTVLMLTTTEIDAPLFRIPILASQETGLDANSFIMADKTMTVQRDKAKQKIGLAPQSLMTSVSRALATFLGIA